MNFLPASIRFWQASLFLVITGGISGLADAEFVYDKFSLRGFYTLDASLVGGHDVLVSTTDGGLLLLKKGQVSFDSSAFGLQGDLKLTDNLSLTGQLVSSKLIDDNYTPNLEWAYVNYDLGDDMDVRAGLRKIPFLQGTELRYVGFSRLWVRPITPDSGASGFDSYIGAELTKSLQWKDFNIELQGVAGRPKHQLDIIDGRWLALAGARLERSQSWIKVVLLGVDYEAYTPRNELVDGHAKSYMASIEGEWSHGKAILNSGLTYSHADVNPDDVMGYLSVGYRWGKWTPYLLLQDRRMYFDASEVGDALGHNPPPPGGQPPPPTGGQPPPPPESAGMPSVPDGRYRNFTFSLGLRFDLNPTTDIKAAFERQFVDDDAGSINSAGEGHYEANVFSIVLDGVF